MIDLSKKEIAHISNIYDKEYLNNEINNLVYHKYFSGIYNKVKESNVDNHTYIIDKNKIDIYFNDINFDNIEYIPYVTINLNSEVVSEENYIWVKYNKGGTFRRWYGNREYVVFWNKDGHSLKDAGALLRNRDVYFKSFLAWTKISSAKTGFRVFEKNSLFARFHLPVFEADGCSGE